MKILHYTPVLVPGSLLAQHVESVVRATRDKAQVIVVSSQKSAIDSIKKAAPDILHVHGSWKWLTESVVAAAQRRKMATVLAPHWMLQPYVVNHEGCCGKAIKKMLIEKRLTRTYDALIVSTNRERSQLLDTKWHDRIEVVASSILDNTCSEMEMGENLMAFYNKVLDTRYQLMMTDEEYHAVQTLLHVGALHDPSRRQVAHENILKIRSLKPSQWRRIFLMADDEDIRREIDIAINVMQIDAPHFATENIIRFPLRHPQKRGPLPRKLLENNTKICKVLNEQADELQTVLVDLVNVKQYLGEDVLSLRHLAELFETIKYTDFNEDDFKHTISELGICSFTQRIMQLLVSLLSLDEGHLPIEAKYDKKTQRYINQVMRCNYKQ